MDSSDDISTLLQITRHYTAVQSTETLTRISFYSVLTINMLNEL